MSDIFLCSTPLQAVIARAIAAQIGSPGYDLVYSTLRDSPADRHYANDFAKQASHFVYLAGTPGGNRLTRQLRRLWRARAFLGHEKYRRIFVASLDSAFFRLVIARNRKAAVYSFDDGAANILAHSQLRRLSASAPRSVHAAAANARARSASERIVAHFSIYPGFTNIVGDDRLRYLDPWPPLPVSVEAKADQTVSFFIGQPFEDAIQAGTLDRRGLALITQWLQENRPAHYLRHPRETHPLLPPSDAGPGELIAEERLFRICEGRRPVIYGWFSTVLFNIGPEHAEKYYLSAGQGESEAERCRLARKAGCRVITLAELPRNP